MASKHGPKMVQKWGHFDPPYGYPPLWGMHIPTSAAGGGYCYVGGGGFRGGYPKMVKNDVFGQNRGFPLLLPLTLAKLQVDAVFRVRGGRVGENHGFWAKSSKSTFLTLEDPFFGHFRSFS